MLDLSVRKQSAETHSRTSLVEKFSNSPRPDVLFGLIVTILFLPSVVQPFLIDDFRALSFFESYAAGERDSLDLYLLVKSPEQIKADRLTNYSPWWIFDDFHMRYFRPLAERVIYGEYKIFGSWAGGYRFVGLLLYILSISLTYRLYLSWLGDESLARWSALIFALAASNALPVVFISAQCDLLALNSCLAAMLFITRFIRGKGSIWLLLGMALYALGLGSKESALPTCVLPLAFLPLLFKQQPTERKPSIRRVFVATTLLLCMALSFVVFYSRQHYGSNGWQMINPLHDPLEYLRVMPVNALMLLSGWILQINPIFTYLHTLRVARMVWFCVLGVLAMFALALFLRRHSPRHPALPAFGMLALAYLPMLACSNADSRVMMLPMVGLAVILGVWLTGRSGSDDSEAAKPVRNVRLFPALVFLLGAAGIQFLSYWGFALIEWKTASVIRQTAAEFQRPVTQKDTVFFLNSPWQIDMLWGQYRADFVLGKDSPRIRYLTHLRDAEWKQLDERTLRVSAPKIPYFKSYIGRVGMTQAIIPLGMQVDAGEFTATVYELNSNHEVVAVDFHFLKPLDSESYRFFELGILNKVSRIDLKKQSESD